MKVEQFKPQQLTEEVLTKREKKLQTLYQNEAAKAQ